VLVSGVYQFAARRALPRKLIFFLPDLVGCLCRTLERPERFLRFWRSRPILRGFGVEGIEGPG
jgi:hypothetical protein